MSILCIVEEQHVTAIRGLIIEEHPKVRRALAARLSTSEQIDLIGACDSVELGLKQVSADQPDIVLLGMKVERDERDTKFISQLVEQLSQWGGALIVLTTYSVDKERDAILRAGARRYLLKDLEMPHLLEEIYSAVAEAASYAHRPPRGKRTPPRNLPIMD